MRVTFDSNAWQRVVRPESFGKDPRLAQFQAIHEALEGKSIQGFISETVGTLEAIKRKDRGAYFASAKPETKITESVEPDGRIKVSVQLGADHTAHPGLAGILSDTLKDAFKLGIRLMSAPRIGLARPSEFITASGQPNPDIFASSEDAHQLGLRIDVFHQLVRDVEARGVGIAVAKGLAKKIAQRSGNPNKPWFTYLDQSKDRTEEKQIESAVAEWADGDAVASHIAFQNDVFCSEDIGVSAGSSILNPTHRAWLIAQHGVRFETLASLSQSLSQ